MTHSNKLRLMSVAAIYLGFAYIACHWFNHVHDCSTLPKSRFCFFVQPNRKGDGIHQFNSATRRHKNIRYLKINLNLQQLKCINMSFFKSQKIRWYLPKIHQQLMMTYSKHILCDMCFELSPLLFIYDYKKKIKVQQRTLLYICMNTLVIDSRISILYLR